MNLIHRKKGKNKDDKAVTSFPKNSFDVYVFDGQDLVSPSSNLYGLQGTFLSLSLSLSLSLYIYIYIYTQVIKYKPTLKYKGKTSFQTTIYNYENH